LSLTTRAPPLSPFNYGFAYILLIKVILFTKQVVLFIPEAQIMSEVIVSEPKDLEHSPLEMMES
jgi:hypothetical protein